MDRNFELGIIRSNQFSDLPEIRKRLKNSQIKSRSNREFEWISTRRNKIKINSSNLKNIEEFANSIFKGFKKYIEQIDFDWNSTN